MSQSRILNLSRWLLSFDDNSPTRTYNPNSLPGAGASLNPNPNHLSHLLTYLNEGGCSSFPFTHPPPPSVVEDLDRPTTTSPFYSAIWTLDVVHQHKSTRYLTRPGVGALNLSFVSVSLELLAIQIQTPAQAVPHSLNSCLNCFPRSLSTFLCLVRS